MGEFTDRDSNSTEVAARLEAIEGIVLGHLEGPPVDEAQATLDERVEAFNGWLEGGKTEFEAERARLEGRIGKMRALESRLAALDRELEGMTPDVTDRDSVAAYNARVEQRNVIVAEHRELAESCGADNEAFNRRIQTFNREAEERSQRIESDQQALQARVRDWHDFVEGGGSRRLNALYASASLARRAPGGATAAWDGLLARMRKLRRLVGEHFRRVHEGGQHGLLIVRAGLGGEHEGHFIVDTAASVTALTPEMACALGIDRQGGGTVQLSLPNAIRIEAPKVTLPSIEVEGDATAHVKGVILEESMPGIDGCLGLSFLCRFDFEITPEGLRLTEKETEEPAEAAYEVFICHKSADFDVCKQIFDVLTDAGKRVFLSEISLSQHATNEYQVVIDEALEQTRHLVVVISNKEQISSPWVASEWRTFKGLKQSGKKAGNLVPFLCGDMIPEDLPASLHLFQAVSIHDPEWERKLLNFLR